MDDDDDDEEEKYVIIIIIIIIMLIMISKCLPSTLKRKANDTPDQLDIEKKTIQCSVSMLILIFVLIEFH